MNCPSCQHDNRAEATFCEECGSRLERLCATCGNALRLAARFCDSCGSVAEGGAESDTRAPRDYTPRHLAERILTSKSALEGERKHVTVLFADVGNYTSLSERSDPEQMHALMDRCFQLILEEVHYFEGTVNQFTGDGVMALFGAPLALEDAPHRAVRAALGIQRALAPLDEEVRREHGVGFRMRIGIHTGPVVVGSIGDDLRMDYTAVGDTTNLAARLEQSAAPGSILISAATESLVSGFFELRDLGDIVVKGKSAPVRAFGVEAERAVSSRIEAAGEGGLTPLVGRARDLEALQQAFEAARSGRGQVVFLVGEAGIGKSRLLHEFRRGLEDENHTWFEGRCASYASNSPFHAVIDGLQRSFGIEDRDDDSAAAAKVDAAVAALGADLAWSVPFLKRLLSLPPGDEKLAQMEPSHRRSEIIRALHDVFHHASARGPLIIAIEDLHWIDAASEEFFGFLTEAIGATPALFVLTHRPGYSHPFGDRSYHVRIALQPLSEEGMSSMASAILAIPELPPELARLITAKSDGNPLFVEEVTRSLRDEGVLRIAGGHVELTRLLQDIAIPDRIQDVLMARIDRLAEAPKRAIQVASVIGREFALRLLEKIAEAGDEVRSTVGELRALELIYEKAAHPELAFMFKHALTHDVAYESVLVKRRRALHRIVGTSIEELYRDRLTEHYDALAHHFSLGEEWDKALHYHELAAKKAADAFANQAATEHYRRAIEIAERTGAPLDRRLELEETLGAILHTMSEFKLAGEAHLRAADIVQEDLSRRARNLGRAAHSLLWSHDYDRSRIAWTQGIDCSRRSGSVPGMALAISAQALQDCVEGRFDEDSRAMAHESVALAEQADDTEALMVCCANTGINLKHAGEFERAVAMIEPSVARAERLGLNADFSIWTLGMALGSLGRYGRVIPLFRSAIDQCQRLGNRAVEARLQNTLGWCLAEIGCHLEASAHNRRSTELGEEMVKHGLVPGAPELYANGKVNLAGNLLALGDHEGAHASLEPIVEELEQPGDPWMRWRFSMHVKNAQARVAIARRDPEQALGFLEQELRGARESGSRKVAARALELRGRARLHMDDREGAQIDLRESLAISTEIKHPPIQWRSLSLLAEISRRSGDSAQAAELAARARALVKALAADLPEPDLRRGFEALGAALESDPLGAHR